MQDAIKRTLDEIAAAIGVVLLAPLLAGIAIAVKATSPGPALYRGVRTGRYGRPFRMLKFRTMVVDAERRGGTTTGAHDTRVTPLGRVLRKYKLDELPQLFNILAGQMSFVGPRPEVAEYTNAYSADERRILTVRPGITDWASLRFHELERVVGSDDPDGVFRREVLPVKIALRLKYVEEQSLAGDAVILVRTAAVVLAKPFRRAG
jgi:lipopolysaccharide/colanic/teichoic acid biosynthesis glycosyltransferase